MFYNIYRPHFVNNYQNSNGFFQQADFNNLNNSNNSTTKKLYDIYSQFLSRAKQSNDTYRWNLDFDDFYLREDSIYTIDIVIFIWIIGKMKDELDFFIRFN
jgi:hypothetical protein